MQVRGAAKPSLTRLLEAKLQQQLATMTLTQKAAHGGSSGLGRDGGDGVGASSSSSFRAFCQAARLSANMNSRVKLTLYYIAALPLSAAFTADTKLAHYRRLVGDDPSCAMMLHALAHADRIVIQQPDMRALREFLAQIAYSGAPCAVLQQFRSQCVPGNDSLSHLFRRSSLFCDKAGLLIQEAASAR